MALTKPKRESTREIPTHVVSAEEIVRVNLNVPASVRVKWKKLAADQNKSMADIIIEAVEQTYFQ